MIQQVIQQVIQSVTGDVTNSVTSGAGLLQGLYQVLQQLYHCCSGFSFFSKKTDKNKPYDEQGKSPDSGIVQGGGELLVSMLIQHTALGLPVGRVEVKRFLVRYQGQQLPPYSFVKQLADSLNSEAQIIGISQLPQGWIKESWLPSYSYQAGQPE